MQTIAKFIRALGVGTEVTLMWKLIASELVLARVVEGSEVHLIDGVTCEIKLTPHKTMRPNPRTPPTNIFQITFIAQVFNSSREK